MSVTQVRYVRERTSRPLSRAEVDPPVAEAAARLVARNAAGHSPADRAADAADLCAMLGIHVELDRLRTRARHRDAS